MPSTRTPLIILLILLFGIAGFPQQPYQFDDSACLLRMKKDVYMLASDSFQGRMSGTAGERMAYEYLISQLKEAGVPPAGEEQNSYLQPFLYGNPLFDWQHTDLVIGERNFVYRLDFGVMAFSANGKAVGPVADVKSGLDVPEKGYQDYAAAGDVAGKILLMDLEVPRKAGKDTSMASAISPKSRVEAAIRKGAIGVIFYNSKTPEYKNLFDFAKTDSLNTLVIWGTHEVVQWIKKHPGDTATLTVRVVRKLGTFHNVAGFIDNRSPYTVILGAHYDHEGVGKRTGLIKHGADDNASGTAMVLELGRYYAAGLDRRSNYLILLFAGEEEWMQGSYWYASHPTVDLSTGNFMFNFDMVGRLGCEGNRVDAICTGTSPEWRRILKEAPHESFRVRKISGAGEFSDHYPFYIRGLPIAYLTTGMHYDYHTSRDRAEKINYTGMEEVLHYAREIISGAETTGKLRYRKVSGLKNFYSSAYYILEQLDYLFHTGTKELD
jgi:aminopeptidase YwaD